MASKPKPPLALIAGSTASGKSALAMKLAQRTDGVLINADSAQVYRDLPLLSAAPTPAERARADNRLYSYLDGQSASSAGEWSAAARREIAKTHAEGRLPILVGGTGLYIRTLIEGIAPVPPIDEDIRQSVRQATVEENFRRLETLDAEGAQKLKPGDTARIARALEVVVATGRPLSEWQSRREGGIGDTVDLKPLILLPPRDWLYGRCDARFAAMVENGALDEVEALLSRNLDPQLPVMCAIGVRELAGLLRGDCSLAEAVAAGQQATRRYAKRQYTWFAHQPPEDWPRFRHPLEGTATGEALELLSTSA